MKTTLPWNASFYGHSMITGVIITGGITAIRRPDTMGRPGIITITATTMAAPGTTTAGIAPAAIACSGQETVTGR